MKDREMEIMLDKAQKRGIEIGVRIMQEKMLLACENGAPIEIEGKAYFIKSDIQNLRDIFSDLEINVD